MHPLTTEARQINASTTDAGAANAAALDLERVRKAVDLATNVTDVSTVTVEVSTTGDFAGEEKEADTLNYNAAETDFQQYDIAYQHVRAYADGNVSEIELVSRGV